MPLNLYTQPQQPDVPYERLIEARVGTPAMTYSFPSTESQSAAAEAAARLADFARSESGLDLATGAPQP
ncbi:MAG: hypothetical protein ACREQ5_26160, partial [Candidatus Dormibacteria bacterium]